MFGKDFWKILRMLYLIIRALLQAQPPEHGDLPDLEDHKD